MRLLFSKKIATQPFGRLATNIHILYGFWKSTLNYKFKEGKNNLWQPHKLKYWVYQLAAFVLKIKNGEI